MVVDKIFVSGLLGLSTCSFSFSCLPAGIPAKLGPVPELFRPIGLTCVIAHKRWLLALLERVAVSVMQFSKSAHF